MKTKTFFIVLVITGGLFWFFFLHLPYNIYSINRLEDGRNYFTSVTAYTTYVVGVLGLMLGLFYYFDKQARDRDERQSEMRRQRLNLLLSELREYDRLVDRLFCKAFVSEVDLALIRSCLTKHFEDIEVIIDINRELLSMSDLEIGKILAVNALVDKDQRLMHENSGTLIGADISIAKDSFSELIKEAKSICFQKTA